MNVELLNRVVKQIESQPESWDQCQWIEREDRHCGTTACVAGWACLLSGWEPMFPGIQRNGVHSDPEKEGEEELGISRAQADWLFSPLRSFEEIKSFADEANKEES